MPPSRRSRRGKPCPAPKTPMILSTLPTDVLVEIVARFDFRTFVRCAAACKLLRRDLLTPRFIRCISQAAPRILVDFGADAKKPLTLLDPVTPAAASFCHNHLSRFLSRKDAGNLLGEYTPISSRGGLVLLQRLPNVKNRATKTDLCVYDPMSGRRTIFSNPPEIRTDRSCRKKYVLLTAADGIVDYSFLLLVFDICDWTINLHTASSCGSGTQWSVTYGSGKDFPWRALKERDQPAVLCGGVIHWIERPGKQILSYNFLTGKTSSVELPSIISGVNYEASNLYLATSSDRKLLKLLSIQRFMLFVWIQLPVSSLDSSGWSLDTVIDMEEKLRSLDPRITGGPHESIEFEGSGNRTGDMVFLEVVYKRKHGDKLVILDLDSKEMHMQKRGFTLLEIDLPCRLQNMKRFR